MIINLDEDKNLSMASNHDGYILIEENILLLSIAEGHE